MPSLWIVIIYNGSRVLSFKIMISLYLLLNMVFWEIDKKVQPLIRIDILYSPILLSKCLFVHLVTQKSWLTKITKIGYWIDYELK